MIDIFFFLMCLVASISGHGFDGMQNTAKEDLDIERELKLINKPPIKSIYTKFGYIVDCIDIYKQPAFDHPLLKNHKLKRKPSFQNGIKNTSVKNSSSKAIFGLEKNQCPRRTVPIRRMTKDDLIRGKSFFNNLVSNSGGHIAEVSLIDYFPYYGVSGTNSVYNVTVRKDQSSGSLMFVRNGPMDDANIIGVGWHVAPQLYNDDATHFYAVWTKDSFKKSGCFNLQCSGFIQTSKQNYLGGIFDKTSIYDGDMFEIAIAITQDSVTKDWWLINENENLGYFPSTLFTNLTAASHVGWGGTTSTSLDTPSPPMGSGHFPDHIFNHACYFRNITYQDYTRKNYKPEEELIRELYDNPGCYGVKFYEDEDEGVGYSLQFGGPGGNCG